MERVRHQLACANCMLANANHPVNKDYHFFVKIFSISFQTSIIFESSSFDFIVGEGSLF